MDVTDKLYVQGIVRHDRQLIFQFSQWMRCKHKKIENSTKKSDML